MLLDSYIDSNVDPNEFMSEHLHLSFPKQATDLSPENINDLRQYLENNSIKLGQAETSEYYVNLKIKIQPDELNGLQQRIQTLFEQSKRTIIPYRLTLVVMNQSCKHFSFVEERINSLKNRMDQHSIHIIQFYQVEFNSSHLPVQSMGNIEHLIYHQCNFGLSTINLKGDQMPRKVKFHFCKFEKLSLSGEGTFATHQTQIECLDSQCSQIMLCNIKEIRLFTQRNLEGTELDFENVKFVFSRKTIKKHCKKDTFNSFLNSFSHIKNLKGLQSERLEIDRYMNYFRSRRHWFLSLLFWFNSGYHNISIPGFTFLGAICLMKTLLDSSDLYRKSDSMALIFNPKDLFGQIILKDFNFNLSNISFPKIILAFLVFVSIYFLFSMLTAVKRRFGFPRTSPN